MTDIERLYRAAVDELWNQGDLGAVDRYFAEAYVAHDSLFPRRGRAELRRVVVRFRQSIADLRYRVDEVVVDGDRIAARWTVSGRHVGELFGVPGSGRPIEVSGMSMNRMQGGQFSEAWVFNDTLSLLRQLDTPLPDLR
jgi:steroid delta-isomerase-like uncharacterized protein